MHYLALVWFIPQVRLPRRLAGESACPTLDRRRLVGQDGIRMVSRMVSGCHPAPQRPPEIISSSGSGPS